MRPTRFHRKVSQAIPPIMAVFAFLFLANTIHGDPIRVQAGKPDAAAEAAASAAVVAWVNGEGVPSDLYERAVVFSVRIMEQRAAQANHKPGLREYHLARGQGFEAVVDDLLRAQAAEKEGIQISDSEVRKTIDEMLKAEMDRMGAGATPQERKSYEQQLRGMADLNAVRRSILAQRLNATLREKFKPTEAELMASFNEVKVRHIMIKATPQTQLEALANANEVLAKLKAGGDFAQLAQQYSQDTGSKNEGGDVGWITAKSSFVPEFTAAARALKKGEIAGPVMTMFGYHIMKADDVHVKRPKDLDNPKKKQQYLEGFQDQTILEKTQTYFASLRMDAKIEPLDPWIAGYMAENRATSGESHEETRKLLAEAIQHYEEAAKRNDLAAGPPLYAKLADLYNTTHQDDKALAALAKVVVSYPSADASVFMLQGEIYERKKDKANAVKAYQRAMKLADSQPWHYLPLQQAFKRLGRADLARVAYRKWQAFNKHPRGRHK